MKMADWLGLLLVHNWDEKWVYQVVADLVVSMASQRAGWLDLILAAQWDVWMVVILVEQLVGVMAGKLVNLWVESMEKMMGVQKVGL